jgi:hypothetical protein
MTQKMGARAAKKFGDSHEEAHDNNECDLAMDLANNQTGRVLGEKNPKGDCEAMCDANALVRKKASGECRPCRDRSPLPKL